MHLIRIALFLLAFLNLSFSGEGQNMDRDPDVEKIYEKALSMFSHKNTVETELACKKAIGIRSGLLLAEGAIKLTVTTRAIPYGYVNQLPKEEIRIFVLRLLSEDAYWDAVAGSEEGTAKTDLDETFCLFLTGIIGERTSDNDMARQAGRKVIIDKIKKMSLVWRAGDQGH